MSSCHDRYIPKNLAITFIPFTSLHELRKQVKDWKDDMGDPEIDHRTEDWIMQETMNWIASGKCKYPQRAAILAARMQELNHTRRYS